MHLGPAVLCAMLSIAAVGLLSGIALLIMGDSANEPRHYPTSQPPDIVTPPQEPEEAAEQPGVALCPLDPDWDWRAAAALLEDTELLAGA